MMNPKSSLRAFALTSVFALVSGPVLAGGWNDWGNEAFSFAAAGGNVVGFMDAYKGDVVTKSNSTVLTRADTNPTYGAGKAMLNQEAAIWGRDRNYLEGGIFMEGGTEVGAQVGRRGEEASTGTTGMVGIYGEAYGDDYSVVEGSGYGKSNEESVAVDTPRGGYDGSEAQQLSVGEVSGHASGDHYASVSTGAVGAAAATAK
jgi:hypothetical protein